MSQETQKLKKTKRYKSIKTYRMSGAAVSTENYVKFDKEWKDEYDKLVEQFGLQHPEMPEKLDAVEQKLKEKYPAIEDWGWVDTQKKWKELVAEYGPIAITLNKKTNELVYIILDAIQ